MQEQLLIFNKSEADSLGAVRCMKDLQAAEHNGSIWLRGIFITGEAADISLRKLPAKHSFILGENDLLFAPGNLTPVQQLPDLRWTALQEFIPVKIPVAALPGKVNTPATIELVPAATAQTGNALRTSLHTFKTWVETAPAIRLQQLKFAANEYNEVLITGNPLPPLPGNEYYFEKNILLPAGYRLAISLMADFINEQFNPLNDGVLLFEPDGSWQKIDELFFVPAKRSAVRLTNENNSPGI